MIRYCALLCIISATSQADYWTERAQFIQDEESQALGSNIKLNPQEQSVNEIIMKYKHLEMAQGFRDPANFPPAMHFFRAKEVMEKSTVFSIIKKMPKGAALHTHDTALMDAEWLVYNLTYRDNLFACNKDGRWNLIFADQKPKDKCWMCFKDLRNQSGCKDKFDNWIKSKFTLEVKDPEITYQDINAVWKSFVKIFSIITPLLTYRPVFEDYLYEVLQSFYNDNVMYMEMRGTLPLIYDLNGKQTHPIQIVGIMEKIVQRFIHDHPDFIGMKFIYGPPRSVNNETVDEYLKLFKIIQEMYPEFIAGFDLVGQEDLGKPLVDFVNEFRKYQADTKFFFHAGETNWYGMSTDLNLVDAVLLNTTRIGHGYAVVKHPRVLEEIKNRGIAVEVNPISNQVLMLVKDLRNHPASILLSENYPVVISSDDPGFWGALPLSHDFYMAFMGLASGDADLRFLKQLAVNSIKYSSLNMIEQKKAMQLFDKKWNSFINKIIKQYDTKPSVINNPDC